MPFQVHLGACFQIESHGHEGKPSDCPNPVMVRGVFTDGAGRNHRVESCEVHSEALADRRRIKPGIRAVVFIDWQPTQLDGPNEKFETVEQAERAILVLSTKPGNQGDRILVDGRAIRKYDVRAETKRLLQAG